MTIKFGDLTLEDLYREVFEEHKSIVSPPIGSDEKIRYYLKGERGYGEPEWITRRLAEKFIKQYEKRLDLRQDVIWKVWSAKRK